MPAKHEGDDVAWRRKRRLLLLTSGLILASELCERLAYYSLSTNLVSRLSSLGFNPGQASAAVTGWQVKTFSFCFHSFIFSLRFFICPRLKEKLILVFPSFSLKTNLGRRLCSLHRRSLPR